MLGDRKWNDMHTYLYSLPVYFNTIMLQSKVRGTKQK